MKKFFKIKVLIFTSLLFVTSVSVFAAPPPVPTPADPLTNGIEIVNVNSDEIKGNADSSDISISSNGQYVVFQSDATNLVSNDVNGYGDIFLRDMESGITERISLDAEGSDPNEYSENPSISSDGRYVAFESHATDLIEGDIDFSGLGDIFVYDRDLDITERVSINNEGEGGLGGSFDPSISSDGRYVAFSSGATNFVEGIIPGIYDGDTNELNDIFVYDRDLDILERVSIDDEGNEADQYSNSPSISGDGRYIAFDSYATNLVADDTNGANDIFVYDRDTDTMELVSKNNEDIFGDGQSYYPKISSDGWYITFESGATNLVENDTNGKQDIFVYNRNTGTIERITINNEEEEANDVSHSSSISSDGRYVVFGSDATNLVADDTNGFHDIFLYDTELDTISRLTADDEENQANSHSLYPVISSDGEYIAFKSYATNLFDGDASDGQIDIFRIARASESLDPYIITEVTPIPRTITERSTIYHFAIEGEGEAELFVGDGCGSSILATALGSEPDDQQIEFSDLEYGETYECIVSVYSDAGYSNELVVGPFTVISSGGSSGSSASGRARNLRSQGREEEAKKIEEKFNLPSSTPTAPLLTRLLKFKMTGEDVRTMQKLLNKKGYILALTGPGSPGNETPYYGLKTLAMIKKFQLANGLLPDGIVGPLTWGVLGK
ncbi:MAG: PD40 domain-containing protein [Candidatus Pacebacteria bacterium]|nr:PD40 domain-containing protein [Candidatus Paceibacterota bacterium]